MKTLVLVHGRAQQEKDPEELKAVWLDSLEAGLAKRNLELPIDRQDVRFPYYGDALDRLVKGDERVEVIRRGTPEDTEEIAFKVAMLDEMAEGAGLGEKAIREASGNAAIERGPLNWAWVQGILSAVDLYLPAVGGTTLSLFTHDVYVYLRRPGVQDRIDAIVRKQVRSGSRFVVVAHSLGTVVAFSVLNRHQKALGSIDFVTVGSPLAIRVIKESFPRMSRASCIKAWYNALDDRDVVALYALRPKRFPLEDIDNKVDVDNFTPNRHGIEGYLSDPEVAERIHRALVTE